MKLPEKNKILLHKNFLTKEECQDFLKIAPQVDVTKKEPIVWRDRTKDITNYDIVKKVSSFLESRFQVAFNASKAQIQNWHIGSSSELHIHNYGGRENDIYNSLIYLNDNYDGGEFYTEDISIKPEVGMLTLFNGQETYHGVKEVKKADRFTLIFWWQ